MRLQLGAPQPLAATHILDGFECGEAVLDEWLKRRALANQLSGARRTFVVANQSGRVYGYYAMAAGAVSHQMATSSVRRNMPDPVPVVVLARLAVDHRAQGIKLGASLLQDAVNRAVVVSQNAGVRAMLVHALHDRAKQFYEHHGFKESPQHPMTLMLRLNIVKDPGTRTIYEKREDNAHFAGDHIGAALASLHVAPGEVTLAGKKFTFAKSQSSGIALDKSIKQVALDCGLRKREIDKFYGRAQKLIARRLRNPDCLCRYVFDPCADF